MLIYKITNKITGKIYIGQTIGSLNKRWLNHCNIKSYCKYLVHAIQKYGKDNFSIEEIDSYKTLEDLNNAEEYYIDWFNCLAPNGYNLESGGHNKKHSQISILKMIQIQKGRKISEEHKLKISLAHTGKKRSEAHKKSMSECRLGHNVTKETRNKISNSRKGAIFSKEHIINMSKPRSEEHKKAISIGKKGKSHPHKGNRRKKKLQIFDAIVRILNSVEVS